MIEPTRKNDRGVTLIELMIVLLIAALVIGGIYTLFATQQRSYFVQDQVAGVQQDARAALTIMARDIRMAGLLTDSKGFTVNTYQFAVNPANNNGPNGQDSITVVLAAEECISSSTGDPITVTGITGTQVTLSEIPDSAFFDSAPDPKSFVAFEGERQVYQISSGIDTATLTLTQYPPVYLANVQARVFRVRAITYLVQDNALKKDENIGGGAQPLVGDGTTTVVEDLQFAYQVQGQTGWFNDPATDFPAGTDQADIEMVRINITMRTAVQDATVQDAEPAAQFNQPPLEDHTTGLNGPDGFRRRVYTTVVKARNL